LLFTILIPFCSIWVLPERTGLGCCVVTRTVIPPPPGCWLT
jgi:hypothetical protein